MLKKDVKIGGVYRARISGNFVSVRIDSEAAPSPSRRHWWYATNLDTGRKLTIRSAAKLRSEVK